MMFAGFQRMQIQTTGATINLVTGGTGSPVLLLHGYPQTRVMWHKIAPRLATNFSLVIPDLRGYGDSSKPPDGENHAGYSKRATAQDQVEMMARLGFQQFAVVGHDRGARVAHRLTLDHPERVSKLAVLDILPTYTLYQNVTKEFATIYYHWFFLIQPAPLPETLIGNNAEFYLTSLLGRQLLLKPLPNTCAASAIRQRFMQRARIIVPQPRSTLFTTRPTWSARFPAPYSPSGRRKGSCIADMMS
jgi:haloacetate dehalogenase